jgi:hypothetical protein
MPGLGWSIKERGALLDFGRAFIFITGPRSWYRQSIASIHFLLPLDCRNDFQAANIVNYLT